MAMEWLQRGSKEGQQELELKPEDIQKAMKPDLDKLKTDFSADIDTKLTPIMEFIAQQKADRDAEVARRTAAKRQETADDNKIEDTDWITDPQNAMQKMLKPLQDRNDAMAALLVRKEVLSDMEYYSDPAFKSKVDAMINAQPMNVQSNASVVMNCYKSIFFDMQQDIKDGKIKSKAAMSTFSGNGTGGASGSDSSKGDRVLSEQEKFYAKKLGVTDADWIKAERELEYV